MVGKVESEVEVETLQEVEKKWSGIRRWRWRRYMNKMEGHRLT